MLGWGSGIPRPSGPEKDVGGLNAEATAILQQAGTIHGHFPCSRSVGQSPCPLLFCPLSVPCQRMGGAGPRGSGGWGQSSVSQLSLCVGSMPPLAGFPPDAIPCNCTGTSFQTCSESVWPSVEVKDCNLLSQSHLPAASFWRWSPPQFHVNV